MSRLRNVTRTVIGLCALSLTLGATTLPAGADAGHGHDREFGRPGDASAVRRTVRIVANDNRFSPKSITVRAGETIRFRIINRGELAHDFTIGPPDIQQEHRQEMMEMMTEGMLGPEGMMPGASHGHDDPNAVLIPPGKTAELVWTFAHSETLQFGCNIPGHYEDGMHGDFIVR